MLKRRVCRARNPHTAKRRPCSRPGTLFPGSAAARQGFPESDPAGFLVGARFGPSTVQPARPPAFKRWWQGAKRSRGVAVAQGGRKRPIRLQQLNTTGLLDIIYIIGVCCPSTRDFSQPDLLMTQSPRRVLLARSAIRWHPREPGAQKRVRLGGGNYDIAERVHRLCLQQLLTGDRRRLGPPFAQGVQGVGCGPVDHESAGPTSPLHQAEAASACTPNPCVLDDSYGP
jgi:hypothetical protein